MAAILLVADDLLLALRQPRAAYELTLLLLLQVQEGDYGRQRLFGAVGWGLFSFIAGAVITHKGIYSAFVLHGALALVTAVPALRLPFGALQEKLEERGRGAAGDGSSSGAGSGSGAAADGGSVELASLQPAVERGQDHRQQTQQREGEAGDVEHQPLLAGPSGGDSTAMNSSARSSTAGAEGAEDGGSSAKQSQQESQQRGQQGQPPVWLWQGLRQLLSSPSAAVFFSMVLTWGFGVGNIESYLFLFLDQLGGSEALMGLTLSVTCAAEVVVFWYSGPLILRLGPRRCTHLVFLAFLLRLLCYATLAAWGSPWKVRGEVGAFGPLGIGTSLRPEAG